MKRKVVPVIALMAIGLVPQSATSATITLGMDTQPDPDGLRGLGITRTGTVMIGIRRGTFIQRFMARLEADDGLPVTGCLTDGTRLELVVKGTNDVRAVSGTCAGPDGLFHLRPVGALSIQTPMSLAARVADTSTTTGRRIHRARSNIVAARIAPIVINESPLSFSGDRYPIQVRVSAPPAGRVGRVGVMRLQGDHWVSVSWHVPDRVGRIRTTVATPNRRNVFGFMFVPKPGTGYITSSTLFQITTATGARRVTSRITAVGTSRPRQLEAAATRG